MIPLVKETEELVTDDRWQAAQDYEKQHWQELADRIARSTGNTLRWYRWKAGELEKYLARHVGSSDAARDAVIEVGSGPIGIVNYLDTKKAAAVDPLMSFYDEKRGLTELRRDGVRFISAKGEEIPEEDGAYSLAVIDNCIDHTQEPDRVMSELYRVLRPGGYLYFAVNVHGPIGIRLRKVVETLRLDEGHPHSYTARTAGDLIRKGGFHLLHEERENPWRVIGKNILSRRLRDKAKVVLGICEYVYTALGQKPGGTDDPA